jgi:hypothetical protein
MKQIEIEQNGINFLKNELANKKMNQAFENGYRLRKGDGGM